MIPKIVINAILISMAGLLSGCASPQFENTHANRVATAYKLCATKAKDVKHLHMLIDSKFISPDYATCTGVNLLGDVVQFDGKRVENHII
ncbi:hypothetical protein SL034_004306 [Vibrio harveyi]|nr:hypothetical protein [Vibrio harveyi]